VADNAAKLIRSVLGSPDSELAMRRQVIELASQNLHQPDVVVALVEALPAARDRETRDALLGLLMGLDTSRFPDLGALHDALLAAFRREPERAVRAALLDRLAAGLRQDERLAAFLVEVLAEPALSDDERRAATEAVSALPTVTEATAALALARCATAPADVQALALSIAERCPTWGVPIVNALAPYFDAKTDPATRLRMLHRLAEAKALSQGHLPILRQVLRNDPDSGARAAALDLLRSIRIWSADLHEQLLWTAAKDADAPLRARAVALQQEAPTLTDEQTAELARRLATDACAGVRTAIVETLRPYLRSAPVRAALGQALAGPTVLDDAEFAAIVDALAPYASRDAAVRDALLAAARTLPLAGQRSRVIDLLVRAVGADAIVPTLADVFEKERDPKAREALFSALKPHRHPRLVAAFCAELVEPGSSLRRACAAALAPLVEEDPRVVAAIEDVMLHDEDPELLRPCVEAYLRPRVARKAEPLRAAAKRDSLDPELRRRCEEELARL